MAKELLVGDIAPEFSAIAVGGEYGLGAKVSLSEFRGQTVVLYFYPKDDTPGCTLQACALRDGYGYLKDNKTVIFGVSTDSPSSHKKFIEKHDLPFPLLSDESQEIVEAYGVWKEKDMYGKKYMGTERATFLIRPDGRIKSIFRKVKPAEHLDMLLGGLVHFEP